MKPQERNLTECAQAGFLAAAKDAMRVAQQTGTPVIVWENGQVRKIACDQLDALATEAASTDRS